MAHLEDELNVARVVQEQLADYGRIRLDIREALDRYSRQGHPLGGFLKALVTDAPFSQVVHKADLGNQAALVALSYYVYNEMPAAAVGSEAKYDDWVECGGLAGKRSGAV